MEETEGTGGDPVVPGVWERAVGLSKLAFGEIGRALMVMFGASVAGIAVVVVLSLAASDADLAWAIGVAISVAVAGVGAILFGDGRFRAAAELYLDHDRIERLEWERDTGTKRPRGRAATERWLLEHPTGRARIGPLIQLGRFEEADREQALWPHTTPDQLFAAESDRQYRAMFTGDRPDLTALRAAWVDITDPRERHHRRECLALQEAQAAAVARRDPIAVLAAARPEMGPIGWRLRVPYLVANAALTVFVLATAFRVLRLVLGS